MTLIPPMSDLVVIKQPEAFSYQLLLGAIALANFIQVLWTKTVGNRMKLIQESAEKSNAILAQQLVEIAKLNTAQSSTHQRIDRLENKIDRFHDRVTHNSP